MIEQFIIMASFIAISLIFLLLGFWMGRKSQNPAYPGEPIFKKNDKQKGEPVIEYDPYAEYMIDKKNKSTVEG